MDKEKEYIKYLIRKEKCCSLDKEEMAELQNYINEYGYPEEDEPKRTGFESQFDMREVFDYIMDAKDQCDSEEELANAMSYDLRMFKCNAFDWINLYKKYNELNLKESKQRKLTEWLNLTLELISNVSPEVSTQIKQELIEQRKRAKFIASENYNSLPVLAAMSSFTVDKYAEGNVNKRYYSGCEQVDSIEKLAVEEAKELFGAEYAYVQPCSGSDANLIAYYSIVKRWRERVTTDQFDSNYRSKPVLLSLDVSCGGHLTHSNPMNIVNELFDVVTYKTDDNGWINYSNIASLANSTKPDVILAGYSAYPRKLDFSQFRAIADENNAILMCDMAHFAGLVAGKVFTGVYDPIPYCDIVTSTTQKTLRAGRGGLILAKKEWEEYISKACPMAHGGPLNNMVASKAVGFAEALKPEFKEYAHQVVKNCQALADTLMNNGINLQTGGTDNHIILINLINLGITGRQAEEALLECNIVTNRNGIPNDPEKPLITSGLRVGPAALTTRGLKEEDMREFGELIAKSLKAIKPVKDSKIKYTLDEETKQYVLYKVDEILGRYPLYQEIEL